MSYVKINSSVVDKNFFRDIMKDVNRSTGR